MSYAAAVDHLHGLTQELAALAAAAPPRKFDLDHMRVLAGALGDPQRQFRSILIAGTNGKGSTAATLAGILAAAGVRTALYTSPHLARVTERIRVSGPHASTDNCQLRTDNCSSEIPEEAFARPPLSALSPLRYNQIRIIEPGRNRPGGTRRENANCYRALAGSRRSWPGQGSA